MDRPPRSVCGESEPALRGGSGKRHSLGACVGVPTGPLAGPHPAVLPKSLQRTAEVDANALTFPVNNLRPERSRNFLKVSG